MLLLLVEAGAADTYSTRGFPGESVQSKVEFANSGQPLWFKIEDSPTSYEDILKDACGEQPDEFKSYLREKTLEINSATHITDWVSTGSAVAIPYCHKVDQRTIVKFPKGVDISSFLLTNVGTAGPKTQKKFVELNSETLTEIQKERGFMGKGPMEAISNPAALVLDAKTPADLPAERVELDSFSPYLEGKSVVLPYSSPIRVYQALPGTRSPAEIISENPPINFDLEAALATIKETKRPTQDQYELSTVGFISQTSKAASNECPGSGSNPMFPPFNLSLFKERLAVEMEKLKSLGRFDFKARVGILDTGLRTIGSSFFEERLFSANQPEAESLAEEGRDDDENGHVDDIYGSNFHSFNGRVEAFSGDNAKHGTRMAAIALGGPDYLSSLDDDDIPIVNLKIVDFTNPVTGRLLDPTYLPKAVDYLVNLVEPKVDVINMSLSAETQMMPIRNTISQESRTLFVVAAANRDSGGEDLSIKAAYPARLSGNHDFATNLITVASHDSKGIHAEHSNWGQNVDIHAPGCVIPTVHTDGEIVTETGSSVAAAIVSFAAGVIRGLGGGGMSAQKIKARLLGSADVDPKLANRSWTGARLNIVKAISLTHDVIEQPDGSLQFVHIDDRESLSKFCASGIRRKLLREIIKIRPNLPTSNANLKEVEYWIQTPHRIAKLRCEQHRSDESVSTDHGASFLKLNEISEIVVAHH